MKNEIERTLEVVHIEFLQRNKKKNYELSISEIDRYLDFFFF